MIPTEDIMKYSRATTTIFKYYEILITKHTLKTLKLSTVILQKMLKVIQEGFYSYNQTIFI